jgi:hypothetical protein
MLRSGLALVTHALARRQPEHAPDLGPIDPVIGCVGVSEGLEEQRPDDRSARSPEDPGPPIDVVEDLGGQPHRHPHADGGPAGAPRGHR